MTGKSKSRVGSNSGHGWVWKRPDGMRMRCGGPRLCDACRTDKIYMERVVMEVASGRKMPENRPG